LTLLEDYHFGEHLGISSYHPCSLNYMEHFHRSFELIFCSEGESAILLENKTYVLSPNQVILIMPYQTHAIKTSNYSQLHILVFSPEYIPDFYAKTKDFSLATPVVSIDPELANQLYCPLFETDSLYLRKSALYHILHLFEHQTTLISTNKQEDMTVQLLVFIEENFKDTLTLEKLSANIGYSSVYVSRTITEKLNSTFPKLLNEARIRHASFLLTHTLLPITEIAEQAGFQNVRTFNRNFRAIHSQTPKDYRKKYNSNFF
jgi:YesN/AraC family two-component response regulator